MLRFLASPGVVYSLSAIGFASAVVFPAAFAFNYEPYDQTGGWIGLLSGLSLCAACLLLLATHAIGLARAALTLIYKFDRREGVIHLDFMETPFFFPASKSSAVLMGVLSYLLQIYLFAIGYRLIYAWDHGAFTEPLINVVPTFYFSIATIATVGYGDIAPKSDLSRAVASLEILTGVAYSVFFFSVAAGFLREPRG
jgi:hypothetical protein